MSTTRVQRLRQGGADSGATPKHKARPTSANRARITDNANASKGRNYARAGMNRRLATQTMPSTPKLIAAHSEGSGTADRLLPAVLIMPAPGGGVWPVPQGVSLTPPFMGVWPAAKGTQTVSNGFDTASRLGQRAGKPLNLKTALGINRKERKELKERNL